MNVHMVALFRMKMSLWSVVVIHASTEAPPHPIGRVVNHFIHSTPHIQMLWAYIANIWWLTP